MPHTSGDRPHCLDLPLLALGWSAEWEESFASFRHELLEPGRVLSGARGALRVGTIRGDEDALVPGRLLYRAASPVELPCAGDWVTLRRPGDAATADQPLLVEAVLPRTSVFVRRAAGRRSEPQALAANVDLALLVFALDKDWSRRRLERWLALALEAGVSPVVVLTKADLCADPSAVVRGAESVASVAIGGPAAVHVVDALRGAGVQALRSRLEPGATVVLLGSSGVGKSTLANRLAAREVAATGVVAGDGRGRHTTSRRELMLLPGGALLLDTPGLREVGLWLGDEDLASVFPEIEALARQCRFRVCTHEREPGCAVRAAVAAGELHPDRVASLRQLTAEREALRRRTDDGAARVAKQKVRALHRAARKHRPREM
jgi:ribosome biogenesis GTPase